MLRGTVRLRDGDRFDGMLAGDITVEAGARVEIGGMVGGDVVVGPDARVRITGMVAGAVVDRGGTVSVTGMVAR